MTRTATLLCAIVTLCLLLPGRAAWADEVRLKNGDRITGTVVSLAAGVLKFNSGHGTLDLPWGDVVAVTVDAPIIVTGAGRAPETVATLTLADGQVTLAPGVTLPAGDVVTLGRPAGPPTVAGGANVGILSTGGNTDVSSLRADGDVVVRADRNRYTAGGVVNRAVDRGVETARNATVSGRYDRFFNARLYANASALFTNDRFRDLDLRSALGLGLGYQVADTARLRLGVEGGYGYVNERFDLAPDESYHALRENAALDVYALARRITFFHRHDGFFGVTGDDNLFIQTRNGVRAGLGGGLVTTIQFDVDYDRSPSPGRKQTDRAVGFTLGYRF